MPSLSQLSVRGRSPATASLRLRNLVQESTSEATVDSTLTVLLELPHLALSSDVRTYELPLEQHVILLGSELDQSSRSPNDNLRPP